MDAASAADAGRRSSRRCSASLTPKDTFNLAACDVDCDWAFDEAAAGRREERRRGPRVPRPSAARSAGPISTRRSPRSLKQVRRQARTSSTSATASSRPATPTPVAFAQRLQRLLGGKGGDVPRRRRRQQLRAGRAQGDRLARRRLGAAASPASTARSRRPWSCSPRSPGRPCAT